ncbi:helix-turn-helix domain-containing protein [Fredinandcohnia sp. QZ13]|uniref:TetR/AcrR family transcriptional regulator n=1 Tax=Fredinandcohnia sp. QZ13 TaxID=3073144 RepID=UPI002853028C|nr:helix-turn-helix domain-containing protein [Fredinandcohnia sp. QZ13]MDR4886230.1 helix-turn-helix domain-containing protein [Fredinandcohnia sp. QZ13]
MKEWIPIPGTNKDTILKVALEEFSKKGYKVVNITELAEKANVTTGAIYHHFGSKTKLYEVIRAEMEQRIIDRMEGAVSLFEDTFRKIEAAMLIGIDFAVKVHICRLLCEESPGKNKDKVESFFNGMISESSLPINIVVIASWRSILKSLAEGEITLEQGKQLIKWMFNKETY